MKFLIIAIVFCSALSQAATFLPVAKDLMWFDDAVKYCSSKGARLPTISELAQLLGKPGGIAKIGSNVPDRSYYTIDAKNFLGKPERFLYSARGYQRPDNTRGLFGSYWSSSVSLKNCNGKYDCIYVFSFDGYIGFTEPRNYDFVRCIVDR